jgi:hypothetical protein
MSFFKALSLVLLLQTSTLLASNVDNTQKERFFNCMKKQKAVSDKGWIKSLFLYGEGMSCIDALVFPKRPDFYSLESLEALSGLSLDTRAASKIVKTNQYSWEKQLFINPNFVQWLRNNVLIAKNNTPLFVLADKFYKRHKKLIKSFIYSYEFITMTKKMEEELKLYKEKIASGYILRHLFDRYEKAIKKLYPQASSDQIIFGIGFWLRREIDGSRDAMHKLLVDFIGHYESSDAMTEEVVDTPKMKW